MTDARSMKEADIVQKLRDNPVTMASDAEPLPSHANIRCERCGTNMVVDFCYAKLPQHPPQDAPDVAAMVAQARVAELERGAK